MTTPFVIQDKYQPSSLARITVTAADDTGTPLTNLTGLVKVTAGVLDDWSDTSIANAASMTYSGTPGIFKYNIPAASLPRGPRVSWYADVFDVTGTTSYFRVWGQMTPIV